ncbi:fucolectin-1-like [Mercenaria mercenaria]|uniref:fucolectin-1-like n=1 Tax=Mercenaria mercenaria TaxID=6596 RepID=UPI00234F732F|nr:fucolectin-1-like [Mercenaria mercenaria]
MVVSTFLLVIIGVTTTTYAVVTNVAQGKSAYQSTTLGTYVASKGVDGNTDSDMMNGRCFHTKSAAENWWYVDLGQIYGTIRLIEVFSRTDCCAERNQKIAVQIGTSLDNMQQVKYWSSQIWDYESVVFPQNQAVRYVKLVHTANTYFHLCEIKVYSQT